MNPSLTPTMASLIGTPLVALGKNTTVVGDTVSELVVSTITPLYVKDAVRITMLNGPTITCSSAAPDSSAPNGSLHIRTDNTTTPLFVKAGSTWKTVTLA